MFLTVVFLSTTRTLIQQASILDMNSIFNELENGILALPNISHIERNDEVLFNDFFSQNKETLDYGNSWPYIVQSTFFKGYKYFDGDTLIAFTLKEPNKLPFVITKALGKAALEKTILLANKLHKLSNEKVILKNLSDKQFDFFRKNGFSDYPKGDCWNNFYNYDDDSFPETVIQLRPLMDKKGEDYKSLRYHLNHFSKKVGFEIKEYDLSNHLSDANNVLNYWVNSIKERYPKHLQNDPIYLHSVDLHRKYISELPAGKNGQHYFANILYANNQPAGFALLSKISDKCVGVYSNFCKNSHKGLSETLLYYSLARAYAAGFEFANFGGAEFENLLEFRYKFNPMTHLQRHHAILYPKKVRE